MVFNLVFLSSLCCDIIIAGISVTTGSTGVGTTVYVLTFNAFRSNIASDAILGVLSSKDSVNTASNLPAVLIFKLVPDWAFIFFPEFFFF